MKPPVWLLALSHVHTSCMWEKKKCTSHKRFVVINPSGNLQPISKKNQDRNLHKRWVLLPWSNCVTDKRSVNGVEKWAHAVWRVMVWDSLCWARYSCCLVIDTTWIIPYRIPTSSKQPSWCRNRPWYKCTLTLQTSLLFGSTPFNVSGSSFPPPGASPGLRRFWPRSLFLFVLFISPSRINTFIL